MRYFLIPKNREIPAFFPVSQGIFAERKGFYPLEPVGKERKNQIAQLDQLSSATVDSSQQQRQSRGEEAESFHGYSYWYKASASVAAGAIKNVATPPK